MNILSCFRQHYEHFVNEKYEHLPLYCALIRWMNFIKPLYYIVYPPHTLQLLYENNSTKRIEKGIYDRMTKRDGSFFQYIFWKTNNKKKQPAKLTPWQSIKGRTSDGKKQNLNCLQSINNKWVLYSSKRKIRISFIQSENIS